jgi:hypothetical protein
MDKHNQKYNFYQVILGKGEYYGHEHDINYAMRKLLSKYDTGVK